VICEQFFYINICIFYRCWK